MIPYFGESRRHPQTLSVKMGLFGLRDSDDALQILPHIMKTFGRDHDLMQVSVEKTPSLSKAKDG